MMNKPKHTKNNLSLGDENYSPKRVVVMEVVDEEEDGALELLMTLWWWFLW